MEIEYTLLVYDEVSDLHESIVIKNHSSMKDKILLEVGNKELCILAKDLQKAIAAVSEAE